MLGSLYLITLSASGLFVLLVPGILIDLATGETQSAVQMALLAGLGVGICAMLLTAFAGRMHRLVERELNFLSLVLTRLFTPPIAALCLRESDIRAIWSYFVIALMCIAFGMTTITLSAAYFEGGLALAVSVFSSAGPVYDALRPAAEELAGAAGGWPSFAAFPAAAVVPAVLLMTVGRLEVLLVFAVVNLNYWLKR